MKKGFLMGVHPKVGKVKINNNDILLVHKRVLELISHLFRTRAYRVNYVKYKEIKKKLIKRKLILLKRVACIEKHRFIVIAHETGKNGSIQLKINAENQFNQLIENIFNDKKEGEFITLSFSGEKSHFLRFSQSRIRQN